MSDLIAREQEYQEALSNLLSQRRQQKTKTFESDVDQLIHETKHRERQEQLREKELQKSNPKYFDKTQVIYKLDSTYKSKLTTEAITSDLKQFGRVQNVQLHKSGKKALVQFVYQDSAIRAVNASGSLSGFQVRRATEKDL